MAQDLSPDQVIQRMPEMLDSAKAATTKATIQFNLTGDQGGTYWLKIHDGVAESGRGEAENPNLTLTASAEDYVKIATGKLDGTSAFMSGKLKVKGDMGLAIKFPTLFKRPS